MGIYKIKKEWGIQWHFKIHFLEIWEIREKKEEEKNGQCIGSPQEFHPRRLSAANKWDAIVLITDVILLYLAHKQLLEQQGGEASCKAWK